MIGRDRLRFVKLGCNKDELITRFKVAHRLSCLVMMTRDQERIALKLAHGVRFLSRELDNLAFAAASSCPACASSRRQSTSLYSHCFRAAPVEFLISYSILCFSATRALCLAFHSVCNNAYSALVFAGSGVAGDEPTHELRGGALHRRQWEPVQKPVQAEDEEDEAEKDARNYDGFGSHG
jgi:hypothetical protein